MLQGYLLPLQGGEDALRTGLRWSELVDPNVRIGLEIVGKVVEELIGLRPKEAAYLVGVLSQVATQGDREALSDQDGRLKAAIRSLLQPLASNGSSSVAVSDKGLSHVCRCNNKNDLLCTNLYQLFIMYHSTMR